MRIDKYLWATRYFKTRSQAAASCRKGRVQVNGHTAKPSREVNPQDTIRVRKDQVPLELKVLDIPASRVGAKLVDIYRMDTTPQSALEHRKSASLTRAHYRKKGAGRPTKKERREMDDYLEEGPRESEG